MVQDIPSNEARSCFLLAEQTPGFCLEGLFEENQCQPPKTPPTWSLKALLKAKIAIWKARRFPALGPEPGAGLHHPWPCRQLAQIYPPLVEIMPVVHILCTEFLTSTPDPMYLFTVGGALIFPMNITRGHFFRSHF